MDIKCLSDLAKVIALCRKNGIETLKVSQDSIEFKLKESAGPDKRRRRASSALVDEVKEALTDTEPTLSQEDILLWSSAGVPNDQGAH